MAFRRNASWMLSCAVQCEICRKIIRKLLFETNDAHQRKIINDQHAHCTKNTLNLWHLCIYDCLTNIVIINIKQVLLFYEESERRRKNAHTITRKKKCNSDVRLFSFIWCISCVRCFFFIPDKTFSAFKSNGTNIIWSDYASGCLI